MGVKRYIPTRVEVERRNRIVAASAAYAYEYLNDPVMSDEAFDSLCMQIDPSIDTGNKKLDKFFREKFSPETGMWVRQHPEKTGLHRIYLILKKVPDRKVAGCSRG